MPNGGDVEMERGGFPLTRHSIIETLRTSDPELRSRAIDLVISAYWKPVYKYLRLKYRRNPEDSQDLTRGFFLRVVAKEMRGCPEFVLTKAPASDTIPGNSGEITIEGLTSRGVVVGTPAFMSPEQASGDVAAIDARTDVYMLGATMFYALTGRAPYDGHKSQHLYQSVIAGNVPSPRRFNPDIPRALAAICLKALAREKGRRYRGADVMSADIGRFLNQEPVEAHPENLFQKAARWLKRNQLILLILLVYVILRALIYFFVKR